MIATYVSVAFLASSLDTSERVIRYWAARGLIPGGIKTGRSWRFRLDDVTTWLEDRHADMERRIAWSQSTNGPEAPSIKPASPSLGTHDESPLAREVRERLLKRGSASKTRAIDPCAKMGT